MATKKITEAQIKKNQVVDAMTLEEAYDVVEKSTEMMTSALEAKHEIFVIAQEVCDENLKKYNAMLKAEEFAKIHATKNPLMTAFAQRDIDVVAREAEKDKDTKMVVKFNLVKKPKMINIPELAAFCKKQDGKCIYASDDAEYQMEAAAYMFAGFVHQSVNAVSPLVWESAKKVELTKFTDEKNLRAIVQNCLIAIGGEEKGKPVFELEDEDFEFIRLTITKKASGYKGSEKACVLRTVTGRALWAVLTDMISKCVNGYGYDVEELKVKKSK